MRFLFLFIPLCWAHFLYCQEPTCPPGIPDIDPEFPGGLPAYNEFTSEHMIYPESAKQQGIEGRVYVQFVVLCDGSIRDVAIMKGVSPELDQEALRIFSLMPRWKPGSIDGNNIQAKFTMPVHFKLD